VYILCEIYATLIYSPFSGRQLERNSLDIICHCTGCVTVNLC